MAYTTINKSTDYFNTKLYTGNAGTNAITGVGFQPDFTWIKNRPDAKDHQIYDAVRGATKVIGSDRTSAEATVSNGLTAFGTDGFTVGNDGNVNDNGDSHVAWNWKAGTTGSGTTTGTGTGKAYSYSVNTTAGFSIVKYGGNSSNGHTIPHHLGAVPDCIIIKKLDGVAKDWRVYHKGISSANTRSIRLNENDYYNTDSAYWYNTTPTSTVFTLGDSDDVNNGSQQYIAYCFTSITGYSKFGHYVGNNGGADGIFVYTGFKPTFVLQKLASDASGGEWRIVDTKRSIYNPARESLYPNKTNTENTTSSIDLLSNGFKTRENGLMQQDNAYRYIYLAFGQSLVGSNNIPCTAR
jgi:hypothetical protein